MTVTILSGAGSGGSGTASNDLQGLLAIQVGGSIPGSGPWALVECDLDEGWMLTNPGLRILPADSATAALGPVSIIFVTSFGLTTGFQLAVNVAPGSHAFYNWIFSFGA